ncbi:helix-turn-helix transcriptional regulator [Paenibacillus albidus]|uniref:helix-turn-helix domain-containing protein n=1 Tax=Paenibacillus albidus TaxID=2041023 RepID=UPI001BE617C4|nr:helix-turn-helix transcriptional regulator [Paenibacillus albidus]MBT2293640.1 helix-turn-helix transcriptional regulator [Paenibacillus albidus]
MLKRRIEYLCKKKNITRKELVEGLVTPAHFANILAERHPLMEDVAERIAERLDVTPSYLLRAGVVDEETLERSEQIFTELSKMGVFVPESYVDGLDDREDTLTVELTTALMKAVYYQQMNNASAYQYLHESYLNFYLDKYGRPDEADLPLPLKKALFLYKIQYFRSKHQYYEVMNLVTHWTELLAEGSEIWLSAQNIQLEACVHLKRFDQAKAVFEQTMQQVYTLRMFHRLPGLYVAYSGYCYAMGMVQEALLALSMAEANLVYAENQGDVLPAIMNNRIIMMTTSGDLDGAMSEIIRFEGLVDREAEETRLSLLPAMKVYRCEVASARKNWGLLAHEIALLESYRLTEDQENALFFYRSQLALAQGDSALFVEMAQHCLSYFEQIQHKGRLELLYEALAVIHEEGRRYKESTIFYRKLVHLLRNY